MSHGVSQRSAEIAVRMALGAERSAIVRMLVGKGVVLVLLGIALGVPGALILNQSLSALLYNIKGSDPAVFIVVTLVLAVVAVVASYVPARRAARMPPLSALREQ